MPLRLRLEFAAELVTQGMAHQQLQKCWYEPLETSETIGELAAELATRFALTDVQHASSLQLTSGGFTLPHNSRLSLLRDGDLIAVSNVIELHNQAGNSGMQHTAMHGISEGGSEGAEHSAGASMDPAAHPHARDGSGRGAGGTAGVVGMHAHGPSRLRSGSRSRGGTGAVDSHGVGVGGGGVGVMTVGRVTPGTQGGSGMGREDSYDGSGSSSSGSGSGDGGSARGTAARRVRASNGRVRKVDVSRPCMVCRDVLGVKRQVRMSLMREHIAEHILAKDVDSSVCGFCGQAYACNSYMDKGSKRIIRAVPVSNCPYFHKFSIKFVEKNLAIGRCSNMPMLCSACVTPTYVWKYHMQDHWAMQHPELLQHGMLPAEYVISDVELAHMMELKEKRLERKPGAKRRRSDSPSGREGAPRALAPAEPVTRTFGGQPGGSLGLRVQGGEAGAVGMTGGGWSNAGGEGSSEAEEGPLHVIGDGVDQQPGSSTSARVRCFSVEALAGVAAQAATSAAALQAALDAQPAPNAGPLHHTLATHAATQVPLSGSPSTAAGLAWAGATVATPAAGGLASNSAALAHLQASRQPLAAAAAAGAPRVPSAGAAAGHGASSSHHGGIPRSASLGALNLEGHTRPPLPLSQAAIQPGGAGRRAGTVGVPPGVFANAAGTESAVGPGLSGAGAGLASAAAGPEAGGADLWSTDHAGTVAATAAAEMYSPQHAAAAAWGASVAAASAAAAAAGMPVAGPVLRSDGSGPVSGASSQPQAIRTVTSLLPLPPLVIQGAGAAANADNRARAGSAAGTGEAGHVRVLQQGSTPGTGNNSPSTPRNSLGSCIALVAPGSTPDTPAAVVDPTVRSASGSPRNQERDGALPALGRMQQLAVGRARGGTIGSGSKSPGSRSPAGGRSGVAAGRATRNLEAMMQQSPLAAAAMVAALAAETEGGGGGAAPVTDGSGGSQGGSGQGLLQFLPCSQSYSRLLQESLDLPSLDHMQMMQQRAAQGSPSPVPMMPLHVSEQQQQEQQHDWFNEDASEAAAAAAAGAADAVAVAVATAAAAAAAAAAEVHGGTGGHNLSVGDGTVGNVTQDAEHDVLGDPDTLEHALAAMADGEEVAAATQHAVEQQQQQQLMRWTGMNTSVGSVAERSGRSEGHAGDVGPMQQAHSPEAHTLAIGRVGAGRQVVSGAFRGHSITAPYSDQQAQQQQQQQQRYASGAPSVQTPSAASRGSPHYSVLQAQQSGRSPSATGMHHSHPPPYDFSSTLIPSAGAHVTLTARTSKPSSVTLPSSPLKLPLSPMASGGCVGSHHRGPTTGQVVVPISQPRGVGTGGAPVRSSLLPSNSKLDAAVVDQAGQQ